MTRTASAGCLAFLLTALHAAAAPLASQGAPVRAPVWLPAIVMGKIVGPDKKGIIEAEVLLGDSLRTTTDKKGRFAFDPAVPGVHDVLVRKIGLVPVRFRVAVTPGDVWDGTITMERTAQSLATVVVLDSTKSLRNFRPQWIDGFADRRRAGLGTFLDRVDIENAQALSTSRLIARSSGITLRPGFALDELQVSRCSSFGRNNKGIIFVDGIKVEDSRTGRFQTLSDYSPEHLWAIEVYKGRGTIPPQYDDPDACLVILLWTSRR